MTHALRITASLRGSPPSNWRIKYRKPDGRVDTRPIVAGIATVDADCYYLGAYCAMPWGEDLTPLIKVGVVA